MYYQTVWQGNDSALYVNFKGIDVPIYLITVSLAVWQRVTVKKGQTLNLSCPVTNAHKTNVDWKNPEGYTMFFNHIQGKGEILFFCHTFKCNTNCLIFGPTLQESFEFWILNIFLLSPPALQDKRYNINKLSESEFTVSISNVTFKDGGNYTCSQYDDHITEKTVEVTVLGENNVADNLHDDSP